MNIIVKGRKNLRVPQNVREYAIERFIKYESQVEEPSICEIVFADVRGRKNGLDKVIHVTMSLPQLRRPLHSEARAGDFLSAIDVVQDRFEQQISKYKDKKKIGSRFPVKYWVAKVLESGAAGPRWLMRKIYRKNK